MVSHEESPLCARGMHSVLPDHQFQIHELDFRPNLEEMQHKTLGFCLALDESLDDYRMNNDLTTLKNILLMYVCVMLSVISMQLLLQER